MSWGERSCVKKSCEFATMEICNVDCPHYKWDGFTDPDSYSVEGFLKRNKISVKSMKNNPTK
jgi:hypothetical protein